MANEEAREAAFETWAHARGYITTRESFDAGVAEGIRQAREAVAGEERRLVDLWLGAEAEGAGLSLRAIDALGEDDR